MPLATIGHRAESLTSSDRRWLMVAILGSKLLWFSGVGTGWCSSRDRRSPCSLLWLVHYCQFLDDVTVFGWRQ
jgi:hypothetical protein